MKPIAAVVLAAGISSRFGQNKLLLPFRGATVIRCTVRAVIEAGAAPVVVVTGHDREAIVTALDGLAVEFVHNPAYREGERASSVQTGLRHLLALGGAIAGALMVLGDQPLVQPSTMRKLMQAFIQQCGTIIVPHYRDERGNPVLIGRMWWEEALNTPTEAGMRALLEAHPQSIGHVWVRDIGVVCDVDTPALYQQALQLLERRAHHWAA